MCTANPIILGRHSSIIDSSIHDVLGMIDLLPIRSLSTVLSVKPEAADLGVTVMDFSYFSALTDLVVYVRRFYLLFSNYSR